MFNVELTWFHHLVMNRDNKMRFPRWRQLVEEHIPPILQKTMDANVLPTMFICFIISDTFDLWMNQNGFNIFALVVNFIDDAWVPKHISVFLFKIPYTNYTTYAKLFSIIIWLFFINLNYFTLHYLRLFMAIINYFWLF
jgi:hypothetical protein